MSDELWDTMSAMPGHQKFLVWLGTLVGSLLLIGGATMLPPGLKDAVMSLLFIGLPISIMLIGAPFYAVRYSDIRRPSYCAPPPDPQLPPAVTVNVYVAGDLHIHCGADVQGVIGRTERPAARIVPQKHAQLAADVDSIALPVQQPAHVPARRTHAEPALDWMEEW